jgi:transcriptional regulator with XRE-family HTH domain
MNEPVSESDFALGRIGYALRQLRTLLNLKQDAFVDIGVHPNQVSAIENGRTMPHMHTILKIARSLNINVWWIFLLAASDDGRRNPFIAGSLEQLQTLVEAEVKIKNCWYPGQIDSYDESRKTYTIHFWDDDRAPAYSREIKSLDETLKEGQTVMVVKKKYFRNYDSAIIVKRCAKIEGKNDCLRVRYEGSRIINEVALENICVPIEKYYPMQESLPAREWQVRDVVLADWDSIISDPDPERRKAIISQRYG